MPLDRRRDRRDDTLRFDRRDRLPPLESELLLLLLVLDRSSDELLLLLLDDDVLEPEEEEVDVEEPDDVS